MRRAGLAVAGTYALAWFLLNAFRASLPVLLPELRRLYGIGFTDAGLVFGALFVGLALVQLPSGLVGDAVGDNRIVFGSLLASSLLVAAFGFVTTVPVLFGVAFLFGVAAGAYRSVAISAVTKAVDEGDSSAALGIMAAGNPLGNLLGPIVAGLAIVALGVVWTPVLFGVVGLAACLPFGVVLFRRLGTGENGGDGPSTTADHRRALGRRLRTTAGVLRSPEGLLIVGVSTAFSAVWQGTFTFLPSYLVEVRQLAIDGSGLVTGLTFGVGVLANVGVGWLTDRTSEALVLAVSFLLGAVSLATLTLVETLPAAVAALVGLGLALGGITPARDTFIAGLSPPDDRGSVVGGVRTTYILIASTATFGTGVVIDTVGFGSALAIFAGILGLGSLCSVALFAVGSAADAT